MRRDLAIDNDRLSYPRMMLCACVVHATCCSSGDSATTLQNLSPPESITSCNYKRSSPIKNSITVLHFHLRLSHFSHLAISANAVLPRVPPTQSHATILHMRRCGAACCRPQYRCSITQKMAPAFCFPQPLSSDTPSVTASRHLSHRLRSPPLQRPFTSRFQTNLLME